MDRFWSLLFLAVPLMGVAIVLGAANQIGISNGWLPESIGPRTAGIDYLFQMIHVLLGIVFLITGLILAFSLWRFRASVRDNASYMHSHLPMEFLWTATPAGILIFLAMHQLPYWVENKENSPIVFVDDTNDRLNEYVPPTARVEAYQYGWRFVYPGRDERLDTHDDLISENILVLPVDEEITLELVSQDVIHSFAINQLRLKQDIVPGLHPHVWFEVNQTGEWEINCMELCGWGHYRMVGRLRVVSRVEFEQWQRNTLTFQQGY